MNPASPDLLPTEPAPAVIRIEHVGLWTDDIERLAAFYATYFGAGAGPAYVNPAKGKLLLSFPLTNRTIFDTQST